jgi:hypothetical protein
MPFDIFYYAICNSLKSSLVIIIATLLWRNCENEIHTFEIRTWESSRTFKISKFDYKGQNTSHWGVFYIIAKLAKCRY